MVLYTPYISFKFKNLKNEIFVWIYYIITKLKDGKERTGEQNIRINSIKKRAEERGASHKADDELYLWCYR